MPALPTSIPHRWVTLSLSWVERRDNCEIQQCLRIGMRNTFSIVFVFVLVLNTLSGCLGGGTDEDTATNPVLRSLSGSIEHTYCNLEPGQGTTNGSNGSCPIDDETIGDYWSAITNLTTLNQSAGESIKIHASSGGNFGTTCTSGAIVGWNIAPDNGDTYNNAQASSLDGILPFAGDECAHTFHHMQFSNSTVYWSVTYEVIPITVVG